ncbi:hypothetical protein PLANTIT3_60363 [Plantibacter sp. T3]|nr:hypothetical protein PLANTIT3_60363 [Plantibacter sp. T3]
MTAKRENYEGQAQRQEDLRQVQGHPSQRPRHGHLREPAPQAAPGLISEDLQHAALSNTAPPL